MSRDGVRERLKTLQMGQTVEQFARRCGLAEPTIRKYLTGERYPDSEQLSIISRNLHVSIDWLVAGKMTTATQLTDGQIEQICELDPEVIEVDWSSGKAVPVVRTYDDEKHHLQFYCIHCACWHFHGRGGKDYPYTKGRGGMAGDRSAHCFTQNSPFVKNGIILDVVGRFRELKIKQKSKNPSQCEECHEYYSAAFNACSCGWENKKKKSAYPQIADLYKKISIHPNGAQIHSAETISNLPENKTEQEFSIEDMLADTRDVLESDTVYRQALASNIRAFKQAVINEGKMKNTDEKIDQMMKQIATLTEIVLQGQAASDPEKKRTVNSD